MTEEGQSSLNTELASVSLEEDEVNLLGMDLLERLEPEDLSELRKHFFKVVSKKRHRLKYRAQSGGRGNNYSGLPLTKQDFLRAVDKVLGECRTDSWEHPILVECRKAVQHPGCDERGRNLVGGVPRPHRDGSDSSIPQREMVMRVVPIETETSFCYAIISKFGRTGVYDGHLQLLETYQILLREGEGRVKSTWVSDAVHLPDAGALAVVCSDRSLRVYDCSGLSHAPLCHVMGIKNVPQCLEYCPGDTSLLFLGDDKGDITTMRFHQPRVSLFRKKHPDKLDKYYWVELESQGEWVTLNVSHAVHPEAVRRISYCADSETVVSCSQDANTAVVVRHVTGRKSPYVFKVARGVRCFHMDRTLRLLVTGSNDCLVRLWNPVVTNRPVACLYGHKMAVEDVLIMRHANSVISCARDGVLKVWDITDQVCLQTLPLNLASLSTPGKTVEFGPRALYPGPRTATSQDEPSDSCYTTTTTNTFASRDDPGTVWARRRMLVACCNQVASLGVHGVGVAPASPPLPPPSREHHAAVPSPWRAAEARGALTPDRSPRESVKSPSPARLESKSRRKEAPQSGPQGSVKGLYVRRAQHELRQQEMRALVEQCAPHLALQLWDLEEVRFSRKLPVSGRMRDRNVDVSEPDKLLKLKHVWGGSSRQSLAGSVTSSFGMLSVQSTRSTRSTSVRIKVPGKKTIAGQLSAKK
uniref:Uncharacterized protein n=1 Tax=Timema poppense TaxID=170557 RepID=A0A7R9DLZ8_TIMPO|nr:unnamed protein product [Timema poppensis]